MKKKETTYCICGKDITNLSYPKINVEHKLCCNCYLKLLNAKNYKRELLGAKCLCGALLGFERNQRRKGLCCSCYSFLQRRIKHGSKDSASRIMDDEGKKCACGRDAQWRKVCVACKDRIKESAEAIRRLKSLHRRQATCLCGNPTRVVRGMCKQCHVYIGYRIKKKTGKVGFVRKEKMKTCICGKPATVRGICNTCYRFLRYRASLNKTKKEI